MFIPLDRLYQFINSTARDIYGDPVVIYRFWPHGSKNINDLTPLNQHKDWYEFMTTPYVWCHDQEPLNYEFYKDKTRIGKHSKFKRIKDSLPNANFTLYNIPLHWNVFAKSVLLHSEKRSKNLEQYLQVPSQQLQSQLISVYYWSHAIIARDWFRYAQYETFEKNIKKQFLIYNRAWTGTREYRLRFTDLLIEHNLIDQCMTFCNPVENDIHYQDYTFENPQWRPTRAVENYIVSTAATGQASADFTTNDYAATEIEVVLETLFDDDRLHLTEKSLRPIACCQPFILMATYGSLQYLRDYGFRTFDTVWDENYDNIKDPVERMLAVIDLMKSINSWTAEQRVEKFKLIQQIVTYNQTYFFSNEFSNLVVGELKNNLEFGFAQIKSDPMFETWTNHWQSVLQFKEINDFFETNKDNYYPTTNQYNQVLDFVKQYPIKGC